jgi:hypothetical protein
MSYKMIKLEPEVYEAFGRVLKRDAEEAKTKFPGILDKIAIELDPLIVSDGDINLLRLAAAQNRIFPISSIQPDDVDWDARLKKMMEDRKKK